MESWVVAYKRHGCVPMRRVVKLHRPSRAYAPHIW